MIKKIMAFIVMSTIFLSSTVIASENINTENLKTVSVQNIQDQKDWYSIDQNNEVKVKLYFFWSQTCPHCKEAHPFIDKLVKENNFWKIIVLKITSIFN